MQNKTMQYTESELETISPIMGQIIAYTDKNVPEGWLPCHGRMLRRHDYPELFKVISTTYGDGDGSNTAFNLPSIISSKPDARHIIFVGSLIDKGGERFYIFTTLMLLVHLAHVLLIPMC